MNKITTVIYVNWEDKEILNEAKYKAKLEEKTCGFADDNYYFDLWLSEHYTAYDIWNMSKEEKEKINSQWIEACRNDAEKELCYERRVLLI